MTRILVTGDRNWRCHGQADQIVNRLIARYGPDLVIVHGAASGVDTAFAEACEDVGIDHEPHPAAWETYGKRAGPLRNTAMVAAGADLCLAVHRFIRNSKGTKGCARLAIEAGIPTWLIDSEDGTPRRLTLEDLEDGRP